MPIKEVTNEEVLQAVEKIRGPEIDILYYIIIQSISNKLPSLDMWNQIKIRTDVTKLVSVYGYDKNKSSASLTVFTWMYQFYRKQCASKETITPGIQQVYDTLEAPDTISQIMSACIANGTRNKPYLEILFLRSRNFTKEKPNLLNQLISGGAPLSIALTYNLREVFDHLLANGASPSGVEYEQLSPLLRAVQGNHYDLANLLINKGAIIKKDTIFYAVREGLTTEQVRFLLEKGANVNGEYFNTTPLQEAIENNNNEMVKLLVAHNADVTVRNLAKATLLHDAAKESKTIDILHYLLDLNKIPLDAVECGGYTALHFAACNGNLAAVRLLLAKGARKTIKNKKGHTPYDAVMSLQNVLQNIIEELKSLLDPARPLKQTIPEDTASVRENKKETTDTSTPMPPVQESATTSLTGNKEVTPVGESAKDNTIPAAEVSSSSAQNIRDALPSKDAAVNQELPTPPKENAQRYLPHPYLYKGMIGTAVVVALAVVAATLLFPTLPVLGAVVPLVVSATSLLPFTVPAIVCTAAALATEAGLIVGAGTLVAKGTELFVRTLEIESVGVHANEKEDCFEAQLREKELNKITTSPNHCR